jgi:mannitol/fructose-specific phosphotransferase system IIA component (Ntr-type)
MNISEILNTNLIKTSLTGENKFQVIEELLDLLIESGEFINRKSVLDALIEREQYVSTGLEHGLAVPHAKSQSIKKIMVSLGISKEGINFLSSDGKPAHYIFLVLSPLNVSGPHLKVLAQITKNFRNGEIGFMLHNANTKKEILDIVRNFK